jgi:4-aminobutyrate aminotransferase
MKYICRKPGKKSMDIIKRDSKVISQCLTREYSFVYQRAKGVYVYDCDDRKYLDFAAGVAVLNIGHNNPQVIKAIREQVKKGMHVGFSDFYAELPIKFAEYLLTFLPKKFNNVFLSNSGTEVVEAAYKLARWHSNKKYTIAFKPSFHGRTMGSLSLTEARPVHKKRYGPFLPVKHSPYCYPYRCKYKRCELQCLKELENKVKSVKNNLASVFIEPIAGEPGYVVPKKGFVKGVREICNKYGALLVTDEVQSGCYRTGKFTAMENFNVTPDIIAMSKSIGGGVPLGATISSRKIMDWPSGSHANTFGGNLLACSAGLATLKFMRNTKLGEKAKKTGKFMMKRLREMQEKYEIIGEIRGIGLMIGIELVKNRKTKKPAINERKVVLCKASEKGLILLPAGISSIRIAPPLILTREQAEKGLDILEDSIKEIK